MATRGRAARQGIRTSGSRRMVLPFALWGVGILAVAAVLVAVDRAWMAQQRPVESNDPAVRVAGAVRSISGTDSVRHTAYDAATKAARVEVSSQYYNAAKPLQENRQYLATEGRLGAQLALYQNTAVRNVTILLYARRTLLATVVARQGQKFDQMTVTYSGPLLQP